MEKSYNQMDYQNKSKKQLESELYALQEKYIALKNVTGKGMIGEYMDEFSKQFDTMFENAPLSYQSLDISTRLINVNKAWLKTLGYKREEVISHFFKEFMTEESAELIKNRFPKFIADGEIHDYQFDMIKKDGSIMTVAYEGKIGYDKFGNFKQTHCIFEDITERKRVEEDLLTLSRAVEQNPTSVVITNLDGNIKYVNSKFCDITGYSKVEAYGENPRILKSGRQDEKFYKELWNTILSGNDWSGELQNKKKNGDIYWERALISPVKNKNGETTNFVAIKEDITEKKVFEETQKIILKIAQLSFQDNDLNSFLGKVHQQIKKVLRAENFYVAFYNISNNTYTFPYHIDEEDYFEIDKPYDLSGGYTDYVRRKGKGKLVISSKQFEIDVKGKFQHYGKTPSMWLGVPLKLASDNEAFGVIAIQDYRNLKAYSEIELNTLEIIANNIAVFIERIKHMEELKLAKEKAQESDRLKSAFLANMSHEIRTPMNGILGFASLLKEPKLTKAEQQEYIQIIDKSGNRMLNIINDIIDISKIEAGLMKVNLQKSDINEQIEYIYTFFKPEIEAKGMKITVKNPLPAKEAIITTDREKLFAILTNLVKNAIKYSEKGTIELGYDLIKLSHTPFIKFYVKDQGIGIPGNRKEAIFERFIQADNDDNKAIQGAGLGLAISKTYVEMLGGKLSVESNVGVGSSFFFTLPYNIETKKNIESRSNFLIGNLENQLRNLKILVADDDDASFMLISIMLRKFCKEIHQAKTGLEAVEACQENCDFDLILMDISMPIMNGYEATRQIRRFNKNVIIIAQTAFAFSSDQQKAIEAGCNDYISKPIKQDKLLYLLSTYFAK